MSAAAPVDPLEPLDQLPAVDHHCHGVLRSGPVDRTGFERLLGESTQPPAAGVSFFDTALGLALRRWCAPVLGLPAHAPAEDYLARRAELGTNEVTRRLLAGTGVRDLLVDTGHRPDELTTPAELAAAAGARGHEVVRLERVAEELAATGSAERFAAELPERLAAATRRAVAVKSIAAYRHGLDLDPARPASGAVRRAAADWWRAGAGRPGRLTDPVLLRFLLWSAVDLGLPLQLHVGYGDDEVDLHRANPLLLTGFLRATVDRGVPVLLLHCYPYHREAGYLARVFPHVYLDVGEAVPHVGLRSAAVLAEAVELAPLGKLLYSSDGFGLPELHHLGAVLFRDALAALLRAWVADGALSGADAVRLGGLVLAGNAQRVYRLPATA